MNNLVLLAVVVVVAALLWNFRHKIKPIRTADKGLYVLLTDGVTFTVYQAERQENGTVRIGSAEYPAGLLRPVDHRGLFPGMVYHLAVEPLALVTHRALEQHRSAVVAGHMFKSGGDLAELLRYLASAAVIAAAIFIYSTNASLASQVARVGATLDRVETWTKSPLQVQAAPTPKPEGQK